MGVFEGEMSDIDSGVLWICWHSCCPFAFCWARSSRLINGRSAERQVAGCALHLTRCVPDVSMPLKPTQAAISRSAFMTFRNWVQKHGYTRKDLKTKTGTLTYIFVFASRFPRPQLFLPPELAVSLSICTDPVLRRSMTYEKYHFPARAWNRRCSSLRQTVSRACSPTYRHCSDVDTNGPTTTFLSLFCPGQAGLYFISLITAHHQIVTLHH